MVVDRLQEANRPRSPGQTGIYEAWYVTVNEPAARRGFWLRYTTLNAGSEAHSALWAAAFHRDDPARNQALKAVYPLSAAAYGEPLEVAVADSRLNLTGCRGEMVAPRGRAAWDLRWTSHAEPFFFLEPRWQRLASAANVGAQPALEVSGWIEIGGERYELRDAPGGQQHTWGSRHALEWNWGYASALGGRRGEFFDGVSTRVRGPAGAALRGTALGLKLGGRELKVNSLPATLRHAAEISPAGWDVDLEERGLRAELAVRPRKEDLIGVTYLDPAGGTRVCYHTEVADLELRLYEGRREVASEVREAAAAFEYASEHALPGLAPLF